MQEKPEKPRFQSGLQKSPGRLKIIPWVQMNSQVKEELVRIIAEIESFIVDNGGIFSDWYVGITEDVQERLHRYHNVKDTCVFVKAPSMVFADIIEKYFIEERKTDGGTGGGNYSDIYVYAYKKQDYTKETD